MGLLGKVKKTVKSFARTDGAATKSARSGGAAEDASGAAKDVANAAATRYGIGTGAGILGAGLAGGGAWAYTQNQKTKREQEETEQYEEFQARVSEIEQAYQAGEISQTERDRLIRQARENYGLLQNPDAPRSLYQYLAQLGPLQTAAVAIAASVAAYKIVTTLIRNEDLAKVISA